jgi:hypothetical protein
MGDLSLVGRLVQAKIQIPPASQNPEPVVGENKPSDMEPDEHYDVNDDRKSSDSSEIGGDNSKKSSSTDLDGQKRVTPGPVNQLAIDIRTEPGFQALPPATQKQLLDDISKDPEAAGRLQQIISSPQYGLMNADQRTKVLNVFANVGPNGKAAFTTLMNREIAIGSGDPPVKGYALQSTDNATPPSSLLDNLNKMVDQPLSPAFADRRKELMLDVIAQAGKPSWHLNQGITGTCAATSVQEHVLRHSPSEYARIIGGLAGPSQSVTLADGSKLDAAKYPDGKKVRVNVAPPPDPPNSPIYKLVDDPRSITERMFQDSVQQYGDRFTMGDPKFKFDPTKDNYGMWDDATAEIMKGIYNQNYSVQPPGGRGISNATSDQGVRNRMRSDLYSKIEGEIKMHNGPVAVHVIWGGENPNGTPSGLHEVVVEKIENGRVYFRNPHGSTKAYNLRGQEPPTDGEIHTDPPPRRTEDAQNGLESMSMQEFQNVLNGATIGPPVGRP